MRTRLCYCHLKDNEMSPQEKKKYLHKMNTLQNDTISVQIVLRLQQNKIFIVIVFNKYCATQFDDNFCDFIF